MIYTTEQLIQILEQELRANWKGERILLSSENRINDSVLAKALGQSRLSKVFAYQDFREQIHQYQQQYQVSGLVWRECTFNQFSVRFPELHNQLIAIERDKEILFASKAAVLDFWRQATEDMTYWLAGYDPQRTTPEYVEELVQQAEWTELDAARTELYLGLCWGNPKECHYQWARPTSGCERIIAAATEPSSIRVY